VSLMAKLEIENNILRVRTGLLSSQRFAHDSIRLLFLIVPDSFKWFVIRSVKTRSFVNLDPVSDDEFSKTSATASDLLETVDAKALSTASVIVADYEGHFAQSSLKDVKECSKDVVERLKTWLDGDPEVPLKGRLWYRAFVDKEGYAIGDELLVRWDEAETVQVETVGFGCCFYVLPKGVRGGMFGLSKGKYGISIAPSQGDLFTAECTFWRLLASSEHGLQEPGSQPST
jgi:hypothetical protein